MDATTKLENFDVLVKSNGTTEMTLENDDAAGVADTPELPLEQTLDVKATAARLGLPSISNARAAFPLSEPVQRLLGAQTHELTGESPSLWTKLYKIIDASGVIWQMDHMVELQCSNAVRM